MALSEASRCAGVISPRKMRNRNALRNSSWCNQVTGNGSVWRVIRATAKRVCESGAYKEHRKPVSA